MKAIGTFAGHWSLEDCDEAGCFLLLVDTADPFRFVRPDGSQIVLDRSFITDGATVPRPFRVAMWLDPWGTFRKAAFIHDFLWVLRYTAENQLGFLASNRVLYEGCRACGLSVIQALIVFAAVTLGGWAWWVNGTKQARTAWVCVERGMSLARQIRRARYYSAYPIERQ